MYAINAPSAPDPRGHYSQGASAGRYVFTSGQVGSDPADAGRLVSGGVAVEVTRILQVTEALLAECGCSFEEVVSMTVLLTNLDDEGLVDDVLGHFFPQPAPARTIAEVSRLPLGAHVEIACVACR